MSESELNNKFRDKLEGYSSDIDQEVLWSSIVGDVPSKKKKRKGVLWMCSIAFLGLIGAYLYLNIGPSSQTDHSKNDFVVSKSLPNSQGVNLIEKSDRHNLSISNKTNSIINHVTDKLVEEPLILENFKNVEQKRSEAKKIFLDDKYNVSEKKALVDNQQNNKLTSDTKSIQEEELKTLELTDVENNPLYTSNNVKHATYKINKIPTLLKHLELPEINVSIKPSKNKRSKKIKPLKKTDHYLQLNYSIGNYSLHQTLSLDNPLLVNDGNSYFAQNFDVKYGRFIYNNVYATIGLNYEIKHKHFQSTVERDTIVPSSIGEQLLATYAYKNGKIDNVSGVPEVVATFTRSVSNLNTYSNLNIGLGLGYLIKMKKLRFHVEGQIMRSIYSSRSGLATINNNQRILDLTTIEDVYMVGSNYDAQMEVGLNFPIYKKWNLMSGMQYRKGLTNQVFDSQGTEFRNSFKGVIGLRMSM